MKTARLLDTAVARITKLGVILCLIVLFVLLLARVIARTTEIPFAAYDEIVELATVWLIILGALALWREGALYRVDVLTNAMPRFGRVAEVVIQVIMLAFAILLLWIGGSFTLLNREVTAFMQIDMVFYYGSIPVAGAIMAVYSAIALVRAACGVWRGKALTVPDLEKRAVVEHL